MKYLLPILFLGFLFSNCGDDLVAPEIDPVKQLATDKALIKDYLVANNLTASESASGLHYIIEEAGTKGFIGPSSRVNVLLKGYFLDGSTFDDTGDCSPITISVGDVIDGFQEGIQLFNVGGKGTIFLPSAIAFGITGNGPIAANTVIAFDIEIVDQKEFESDKIRNYLTDNNIVADSTLSGIYYIITESGAGESPTASSTVTVAYKGYLADGTVFDESNPTATFELSGVIRGWQEVLPLLKKEGAGTFLIPSNLAYGESGSGSIPSNTMLIFDIVLLEFRN
ncbi:MAG: FKBP-type peptidyl-prolyl cis-trans isomerase [Saprospiraceae bacterium]